MKYAREYDNTSKIIEQIDEIIFNYPKQNKDILKNYIQEHPNQRIILKFYEEEKENPNFMSTILEWKKEGMQNFSVLFPGHQSQEIQQTLKDAEISYFFGFPVDTWDVLHSFMKEGVSDIYITGQLGFELDKVRKVTRKNNIQIRVYPNLTQRDALNHLPCLKSFFIRPEDVSFYEPYVDVFELLGFHTTIDIIYQSYKDKRWYGRLREFIINFEDDFDTKYIPQLFGLKRPICQRKCLKGDRCRICDALTVLSETMKENNYMVPPNKKGSQ